MADALELLTVFGGIATPLAGALVYVVRFVMTRLDHRLKVQTDIMFFVALAVVRNNGSGKAFTDAEVERLEARLHELVNT